MEAELRMQLDLRALVDDMIREGWQVVSRSPVLLVSRGRVIRQIMVAGKDYWMATL